MAQQQRTDVTIDEAIEALSGKIDGFWHQSYQAELQQEFKFWVNIENAGSLFSRLQPLGENLGIVFSEDDKVFKADLSPLLGEEAPFGLFIESTKGSNDLTIYSHPEWTVAGGAESLAQNPEFAKLAKRLPKEALAYSYSVGADFTAILEMMDASPETAKYKEVANLVMDLPLGDYLKPTITVSSLQDGALIGEQYAGYSTKQAIMVIPAVVGGGLGAAMAIPAFQKVRETSQQKAVTNNLRQIAAAANQHFLENGATEVIVEQLVGDGAYIRQLDPVMGENYDEMIITTEMKEISITLPNGETISLPL